MCPAKKANSALPTDPAIPPIPTTAPTALRGNISDDVVNRLADHPWCAPAARLISAIEHCRKPRVVGRQPQATEGRRQPTSADAANGRHVIDNDKWQSKVREVQ